MTPSICLYYRQLCSDMFTTDIAVVKMKLLKYITFGHNIFLYKNYTNVQCKLLCEINNLL